MNIIRARINFNTERDIVNFITLINQQPDIYCLEDFRGEHAVNPASMLGLLYARADFSNGMYLINLTNNGIFPSEINDYRIEE